MFCSKFVWHHSVECFLSEEGSSCTTAAQAEESLHDGVYPSKPSTREMQIKDEWGRLAIGVSYCDYLPGNVKMRQNAIHAPTCPQCMASPVTSRTSLGLSGARSRNWLSLLLDLPPNNGLNGFVSIRCSPKLSAQMGCGTPAMIQWRSTQMPLLLTNSHGCAFLVRVGTMLLWQKATKKRQEEKAKDRPDFHPYTSPKNYTN